MPATPLKVYIADDTPAVAEMLTEVISRPGRVEVVGVGGTEESILAAIASLKPDVVILDLQLKQGSGIGVIRAVKGDTTMQGVRILVTSNHASPQMRAGCLELGADEYFDKVKEVATLTARIAELAGGKAQDGE